MTNQTTEEYTAAGSLTYLEGLDAVRKRPGMYIGSTDGRGLTHCVYEIVDNSVDEALAGHCSKIGLTLHADGSVEVHDNGRGIPVDIEPRSGLPGIILIFEKLHAGGKFGGSGYKVSGGLHGVGASVVNALSERLEAEVDRDKKTYAVSFQRGVSGEFSADGKFKPGGKVREIGKAKATGTRVRFWPDPHIFIASAHIEHEAIIARARQTAFLVPGLEISVTDERGDAPTTEVFKFDNGLVDFVEFIAADPPLGESILITDTGKFTETIPVLDDAGHMTSQDVDRDCEVEVVLRWGTGYEPNVKSFVNIVSTPKGGTHVAGFERALTKAINEAARDLKVLKANDESIEKGDWLEGLTAIVTVKLSEPQFEGQTKEILGTPAVTKIVNDIVTAGLRTFFTAPKRKVQAKIVLEKCAQASRTRHALRLQRETIRRKTALESSTALPEKLKDCHSNDTDKNELFIIEGDSAAGTVKDGRDSDFQAYLPIRGKILNTLRATEKRMLDNNECAAIISALGAGAGRSFDVNALRYGKLIVLADADVDGSHIRTLLLTLCFRYLRPMLEAGRVYAAVPPLHRVVVSGSGQVIYTYSDEELGRVKDQLELDGKKTKEVQRYKGLGEMDKDQLAETTLDIDKRHLRRITLDDAAGAEEIFAMLMGDDVPARRDFIMASSGLLDRDQLDV